MNKEEIVKKLLEIQSQLQEQPVIEKTPAEMAKITQSKTELEKELANYEKEEQWINLRKGEPTAEQQAAKQAYEKLIEARKQNLQSQQNIIDRYTAINNSINGQIATYNSILSDYQASPELPAVAEEIIRITDEINKLNRDLQINLGFIDASALSSRDINQDITKYTTAISQIDGEIAKSMAAKNELARIRLADKRNAVIDHLDTLDTQETFGMAGGLGLFNQLVVDYNSGLITEQELNNELIKIRSSYSDEDIVASNQARQAKIIKIGTQQQVIENEIAALTAPTEALAGPTLSDRYGGTALIQYTIDSLDNRLAENDGKLATIYLESKDNEELRKLFELDLKEIQAKKKELNGQTKGRNRRKKGDTPALLDTAVKTFYNNKEKEIKSNIAILDGMIRTSKLEETTLLGERHLLDTDRQNAIGIYNKWQAEINEIEDINKSQVQDREQKIKDKQALLLTLTNQANALKSPVYEEIDNLITMTTTKVKSKEKVKETEPVIPIIPTPETITPPVVSEKEVTPAPDLIEPTKEKLIFDKTVNTKGMPAMASAAIIAGIAPEVAVELNPILLARTEDTRKYSPIVADAIANGVPVEEAMKLAPLTDELEEKEQEVMIPIIPPVGEREITGFKEASPTLTSKIRNWWHDPKNKNKKRALAAAAVAILLLLGAKKFGKEDVKMTPVEEPIQVAVTDNTTADDGLKNNVNLDDNTYTPPVDNSNNTNPSVSTPTPTPVDTTPTDNDSDDDEHDNDDDHDHDHDNDDDDIPDDNTDDDTDDGGDENDDDIDEDIPNHDTHYYLNTAPAENLDNDPTNDTGGTEPADETVAYNVGESMEKVVLDENGREIRVFEDSQGTITAVDNDGKALLIDDHGGTVVAVDNDTNAIPKDEFNQNVADALDAINNQDIPTQEEINQVSPTGNEIGAEEVVITPGGSTDTNPATIDEQEAQNLTDAADSLFGDPIDSIDSGRSK